MKSNLSIRNVTPQIVDAVMDCFWHENRTLGPELLGVVDAVEFKALLEKSQEWPIVVWSLKIIRDRKVADPQSEPELTIEDIIEGQIFMALRLGVIIGLETAATAGQGGGS